jgi:hypothetical protein
MLSVVSLIDESKNVEGFTIRESTVRSKLETTNTHVTPDNQFVDIYIVIFKIN